MTLMVYSFINNLDNLRRKMLVALHCENAGRLFICLDFNAMTKDICEL